MKTIFAVIISTLAVAVRSALIISQPLQSSNWKPATTVPITWMNSDRSQSLSGKIIMDLMEGKDSANLNYVLTITESQDASQKMLKYFVPSDLPSSKHYTIRITSESGDQFYSSIFTGGSGEAYNGQLVQQTSPVDSKDSSDAKDDNSQSIKNSKNLNRKNNYNDEPSKTPKPDKTTESESVNPFGLFMEILGLLYRWNLL
ncbi:hypothetical protein BB561_004433 [Smittium simulii]|uniref:Yeast cell wall synthesis Kre9/Knh1-like N-terminal domain-containing protein n=1 Tax=Smittium simulii TaxID=133385 RepID=A0A2T9YG93_9FUNG|nr:hypothetical protein BB561_004433 [Smittium simulii]